MPVDRQKSMDVVQAKTLFIPYQNVYQINEINAGINLFLNL